MEGYMYILVVDVIYSTLANGTIDFCTGLKFQFLSQQNNHIKVNVYIRVHTTTL